MPGIDFLVPIDRASTLPLRDQLYRQLRQAILDSRLAAGARLPSTRAVAQQTGLARQTVVEAFDQLIAEGYVVPRPASGTTVADTIPDQLLNARSRARRAPPTNAAPGRLSRRGFRLASVQIGAVPDYAGAPPFQTGTPALDDFPFELWARISSRLLLSRPVELLAYGDPGGYRPLREALAAYLGSTRAVRCTPEQILVTAGAQQAMDLVARLLADPDDAAWIEEPGYVGARAALAAAGLRLVPLPVDGEGLDVESGRARWPNARLAYVTPSRQYPLGVTMSLQRRRALLAWAQQEQAWILEDDYDSEYRYAGRPLASLQGLDEADRVLYLGTLSKVLFPALRLGYVVVPPPLIESFTRGRALYGRHAPGIDQAVLAEFIADGHLARHIRRMRRLYGKRQAILVDLCHRHLAGLLEVAEAEAGMQLTDNETATMKLTTTTQVSVDGVMQGPGGTRTSAAYSSAADAPTSTTQPGRSWTRSTSARTSSCSGGGPTRSSPALGERPVHLPGGRRPGHAAVPQRRPEPGARTGRIASHTQRSDDASLPARRPPVVRNGHADQARDIGARA
jgi:GntR family transcriptional regulator/MocR family aminotransferase